MVNLSELILRLKASTLVEIIVAMVIISTVFVLSLAVFVNISKNSNNGLKLKAALISEEVMVSTRQNKLYIDEEIDIDHLDIIKRVSTYKSYKDLVLVSIEIKDKRGKSLLIKKEIMILNDKNTDL